MKRAVILVIILIISCYISINPLYAEESKQTEDDLSNTVEEKLDLIDFDVFDDFLHDNIKDSSIMKNTFKSYVEGIISGKFEIGLVDIVNISGQYILSDIMSFFPLIVIILSISILFSIVDGISSKFTSKSTTEIIYFVCYITIIVATVTVLTVVVRDAIKVTRSMTEFMNIMFPVLLTLMTSLGGVVTVSAYKPLMLMLSSGIAGIVTKLIVPIFIATIVFSIVGNLSANIKLEKMTKSIKSVGSFLLGAIFSLFTTFVTIQGITGAVVDNVSLKSAKFAISSYVPILGGYLSDGFDLVMASVVLIKNAIGLMGIIVIILITLLPVLKMILFTLILKMTSGIIEPICDERISSFVYSISENMSLLIAVVLGVAFMFFITCMLVILSLNTVI